MKYILAGVFFLVNLTGNSQEGGSVTHTIKGKIVDAITSEAVSYTNIGLEGTYYGTASDADGNFELKVPSDLATKNIYFSAVGFDNKMFPVQTLFDKEFHVIKLESKSYGIEDIDVAAQSKVLLRILRMASESIPVNFIGGPFNLLCNYENSKTIDDTIKNTEEANILIYDKNGYSNPSVKDAFESLKFAVKKTSNSDSEYRFSTGNTLVEELLGFDWVRTASSVLSPGLLPGFELQLLDEPVIDGQECWTIGFSQAKPTFAATGDYYANRFSGEIVIGKNDYDVKKITGNIQAEKNNIQGRMLAVRSSNKNFLNHVEYRFEIQYSNLKPDYILQEKTYNLDGSEISEKTKLTITQVRTLNPEVLEMRDYFTGG